MKITVRDPLTCRRVSITCSDRHAGRIVKANVARLRRDFAQGLISDELVHARMRRLRGAEVQPTVSQLVEAYASTLGLTTAKNVRTHGRTLLRSLASEQVVSLTAMRMGAWLGAVRRQGYADSSVRVGWLTLRGAIGAAVRAGTLARPPWGQWRPPKLSRAAQRSREFCRTAGELAALLVAAEAYDRDRRERAHVYSATRATIASVAWLGLRSGEAAALRWSDLSADLVTVRVERTIIGSGRRLGPVKGRRPAVLAVPDELRPILEEHRTYLAGLGCSVVDGVVFPSPDHGARDSAIVLSHPALREIVRAAQLPRPDAWTTTSLRDTHSTLAARSLAGDLGAWLAVTRHASLSAAQRYLAAPR
jgi:integrase